MSKRSSKKRSRGSRTSGGGSAKNRKGSGHRGGVGKAGSGKRSKTKFPNYEPPGQKGFTRPVQTIEKEALNVGSLYKYVREEDGEKIVDLSNQNVKVLGMGNIDESYTVKAKSFSSSAKRKIEDAGGKVEVVD